MAKQQSMSPIHQPLHIARKDALHLWPETLLSLALLIAFAWAETQIWLPSDGTLNVARIAHPIIKFLLIVSWTVLVSRLVHDEELVGDRQFWITRPYTWYGLLLAKVLYLVGFIGLPFFIMQAWLLHHAGLYPTQCIPALLKDVLVIGIVALLPLLAIAAVTATFVRYISSVLVGLIYALIVIAVAAFSFADKLSAPWLDNALFGTLIAIILLALVLMYWSRKSLLPRVLLIAGPLIFLFGLFTPVNLLIDHRYPNTSVGTATFDPKPPARAAGQQAARLPGQGPRRHPGTGKAQHPCRSTATSSPTAYASPWTAPATTTTPRTGATPGPPSVRSSPSTRSRCACRSPSLSASATSPSHCTSSSAPARITPARYTPSTPLRRPFPSPATPPASSPQRPVH